MEFLTSAHPPVLARISYLRKGTAQSRIIRRPLITSHAQKKGRPKPPPHPPEIFTSVLRYFFTSSFLEHRQQLPAPLRKLPLRHDQAHNQMPILREIVKVPWMNVNPFLRQQVHSKLIIGPRRRHAHDRIPPALDFQPRASLPPPQFPIALP